MELEYGGRRLICGAHEAGHLLLFRAAKLKIIQTKVWGIAEDAQGHVIAEDPDERRSDPKIMRTWLIGMVAGEQAGLIAADKYGIEYDERDAEINSAYDLGRFAEEHKGSGLTLQSARGKARDFLYSNWDKIDEIAYKLALYGKL